MRILHVGSGLRPWRRGGLVAYVEDLMGEQVARGHDVAYFFSGRQYPLLRRPRLRRWPWQGVAMFEVVNSPIYDHGRQPALELAEPRVEALLAGVLDEVRPDVVHVQELAGLPSSVLGVIRRSGTPVVVTLQDYFPLCPAFKLLDADGRVCLRREVGADCVATTAADDRRPGVMVEITVRRELVRLAWRARVDPMRANRGIDAFARAVAAADVWRRRRRERADGDLAALFQRRRDVNVERLSQADCLIAMSTRVAEIYAELGVDERRLRTMQLTLGHIERLRPRAPRAAPRPLTFATLAGFESAPKGALVLLDALRRLSDAARDGRFTLAVYGYVDPQFADAAARTPGVELRGHYAPDQLDAILDGVDVGLVPSVWEEAYGYAGMEFLAKGIPVIANAIGGMTDYTREGETGWLNRSLSGRELAEIMRTLIDDAGQVAVLSARVLAARDEIVKPVARHADEMDALYRGTQVRSRPHDVA